MVTTVGQIMVNNALPPALRDYGRTLGKSEADALLALVAKDYPDKYEEVSKALNDLGRHAAYEEGTTIRLSDIQPAIDKSEVLEHVRQQERRIRGDRTLSPEDKQEALEGVYLFANDALKKMTYDATLARENPFALQVKSKARGNPDQLAGLLTSPGVYQDGKDRIVPVFIGSSYAEGLEPHEYWAATYGARKGVVSTKFATRQAGYLGKLLGSSAMDAVVTSRDCQTPYGIPADASDDHNIGSVLARDTAGIPAGTIIDSKVLNAIRKKKVDEIVVRSPITCGNSDGLCSKCVGLREGGELPPIGYHIGSNASSALANEIAQSSLNVKHQGRKQGGLSTFSGFDVIKNLATVPKNYPDHATVAEEDGTVEAVDKAPQGGHYVTIGGRRHYVTEGMPVLVKPGERVEAGDQLSDGVVNPADVVRLKGVGDGARYFANRFTQAFKESKHGVHRRNVEVLARSMVNHVQINDPEATGGHLPGDIVRYSNWARNYKPRKDATRLVPRKAIGSYLEEPALHYSVGTRVTRKVADKLAKHGTVDVLTHRNPVGVDPVMLSVVKVPEHTGDWMARLGTTYLQQRLLQDVQRGAVSNLHGTHPIPGIAKGVEFGEKGHIY